MSVSEAESLTYFEELHRQNSDPLVRAERVDWQERAEKQGVFLMHSCVDTRYAPASTFDPRRGPALAQVQSFGGTVSPDRFSALSMGKKRGRSRQVRGHMFVSHWGNQPHHAMGFDGCGARHASAEMEAGGEVGISGAPFIREQVEPNCIEGALNRALETSESSRGPSVAIGLDHLTQWPHLLGIAENGGWHHIVPSLSVRDGVPEIEPNTIREEYPDIARIIEQGRIFSRTQTLAEIESRKKQDPMAVWISGTLYPTWDVWGTIPLGQIMRITYARHSAERDYQPRGKETDVINAHLSYPFAQASGSTPVFPSTNLTIIDGKTPKVVTQIFEDMQHIPETSAWLESGPRAIIGVIMRAGNIEDVRRLY